MNRCLQFLWEVVDPKTNRSDKHVSINPPTHSSGCSLIYMYHYLEIFEFFFLDCFLNVQYSLGLAFFISCHVVKLLQSFCYLCSHCPIVCGWVVLLMFLMRFLMPMSFYACTLLQIFDFYDPFNSAFLFSLILLLLGPTSRIKTFS